MIQGKYDKYYNDLINEVIKQLIQDFTASYFNCVVSDVKPTDNDLYQLGVCSDCLERGELMQFYFNEEERANLIRMLVKRTQMGYVYNRGKEDWIKCKKGKRVKVSV